MTPPIIPNLARKSKGNLCMAMQLRLSKERPRVLLPSITGPDQQPLSGSDRMAHKAHNAPSAHTQRFIDPIISQARLINEAAAIDRALAARKALRPKRSAAACKGWEARRG